jgi:glutathione synthase/RimK-type ligase-like ATP-grasp enzyme
MTSSSSSSSSCETSGAESAQQVTKLVFLTYDELPDGDPDDLKVLVKARELGMEIDVLDWRKVDLGSALATGIESIKENSKVSAEEAGEKTESKIANEAVREIDSSSKRRTVYVLRSTWNYHLYYEQFHDFLEHFLGTDLLINDAQLVLWNTDKRYLQDLATCGIAVVPTLICSASQYSRRWILESGAFRIGVSSQLSASDSSVNSATVSTSGTESISDYSCTSANSATTASSVVSLLDFPCSLEEFIERIKTLGWLDIVVKPAIGLSSYGVKRFQLDNSETAQQEFERAYQHAQECSQKSPVLVQPYVASVATLGERCLVFIDGKFSHAIMKKPFQHMAVAGDAGETKFEASAAEIEFASRVLAQLPIQPLYARVDIVPKGQEPALEQETESASPGPEHESSLESVPFRPEPESKAESAPPWPESESKQGTALSNPEYAPNHATKQAASEFYLLELELVEPSLYFCFKEEAVNSFAEALRLRGNAVRHEEVAFLKQTFKFLDKPPSWFALLFWFHPVTACYVISPSIFGLTKILDFLLTPFVGSGAMFAFDEGVCAVTVIIVIYCLPILFLLPFSSWIRSRFLLFPFVWWLVLDPVCGLTQGGLMASVERAFSILHINQAH